MSKRYKGQDEDGEFVVWTDSKSPPQSNKKYTSGKAKDEHRGYDPKTQRSFSTGNNRDWRNQNEEEDDSGCYITTAAMLTMQDPSVEQKLLVLKEWRYKVLESTQTGLLGSNLYRKHAKAAAKVVSSSKIAGWVISKLLVEQALFLLKLKITNKALKAVRNLYLRVLFYIGLAIGLLLKKVTSN